MINRLTLIAKLIRVDSGTTPKGKQMTMIVVEMKDWQGNPVPLSLKAWGRTGEAARNLREGDWIAVDGHLDVRLYQGRTFTDVSADQVTTINIGATKVVAPSDSQDPQDELAF